jgi:alkanesulfonate monooxygenase SsuD/methylene tetrahydromethanopterin reductase-like flavin-dependent oxidoreductase (luciferase family)
LLALTERLTIFGTVHTPLFDPVIAAKQMVTADHAGRGRFGLNVVCGWNQDEFAMFGREQRDHTARYEHGQEWLDAVRMMWECPDEFDFAGRFFQLQGVRAKPKPFGGSRPVIMNAGRSPEGQAFAMRNCDAFFTGLRTISFDESTGRLVPNVAEAAAQVARVQEHAARLEREIAVFTRGEIVCRPTQAQAREYFHYAFEEHADWDGVDRQIFMQTGLTAGAPGFEAARTSHVRRFPIVGDPDAVAALLAQVSGAGFSGIALGFINYLDELPYFCTEVLPRLERLGLREP